MYNLILPGHLIVIGGLTSTLPCKFQIKLQIAAAAGKAGQGGQGRAQAGPDRVRRGKKVQGGASKAGQGGARWGKARQGRVSNGPSSSHHPDYGPSYKAHQPPTSSVLF